MREKARTGDCEENASWDLERDKSYLWNTGFRRISGVSTCPAQERVWGGVPQGGPELATATGERSAMLKR
jgi:hypothetical protein